MFCVLVPEDQENRSKICGSRGPYNKGHNANKSPKLGKEHNKEGGTGGDAAPVFKGPKTSPSQGDKGGPRRRRTR